MRPMHLLHLAGGAIVLLSAYNLVLPTETGTFSNAPDLASFPTNSDITNLLIGGAIFAVPFFV